MYAVLSCVVGWVVAVVVTGVVGRAGCLSLLLMMSLSTASNFELSSAEVSTVVSLVRSLSSLLVLSGCKKMLRSSSHLLAGLNSFRYPFAWLILLGSSWRPARSKGLRGVWQSSLPASSRSGSV